MQVVSETIHNTKVEELLRFVEIGEYEKGANLIRGIANIKSLDWHTLYLGGLCHRFTGNFAEAIKLYEMSLSASPPIRMNIMNALAVAFQQLGDFEKSIAIFDENISELKKEIGTKSSLEMHEQTKSLSCAYNSRGLTFRLWGETFGALNKFHALARDSYHVAFAIEHKLLSEVFVYACHDINGDASKNVDVDDPKFREVLSIKLKSENLEYCLYLLNFVSALAKTGEYKKAKNYIEIAGAIIDEDHYYGAMLKDVLKHLDLSKNPRH